MSSDTLIGFVAGAMTFGWLLPAFGKWIFRSKNCKRLWRGMKARFEFSAPRFCMECPLCGRRVYEAFCRAAERGIPAEKISVKRASFCPLKIKLGKARAP